MDSEFERYAYSSSDIRQEERAARAEPLTFGYNLLEYLVVQHGLVLFGEYFAVPLLCPRCVEAHTSAIAFMRCDRHGPPDGSDSPWLLFLARPAGRA
jgi:hypothetical protein